MADDDVRKQLREVKTGLDETGTRIRRYTLDPRLRATSEHKTATPDENAKRLREMADQAWTSWIEKRKKYSEVARQPSAESVDQLQLDCIELDRSVDLLQRELIAHKSFDAGLRMAICLAVALVALVFVYLVSHGVHGFDFSQFEPWPEWGPLKYGEVIFWSTFGVLCFLIFKATDYMARRDFDEWYQPWYASTALRAPFFTVILMMIVLEFVEWYADSGTLHDYLLAEGNKFYFIVFMSFCLGLTSDTTSGIMRDLSEGVSEFVARAISRVSRKISTSIADVPTSPQ